MQTKYITVDEYIHSFEVTAQLALAKVRAVIKQACPNAIETISYAMPAYKLNGKIVVYFAGYKNHIGLYATPTGHIQFKAVLVNYKQGKASVQFPLNVPLPVSLIKKIVLFKQAECLMPNTKNKLAPKDNNVSIFTNTLSSSLKPEVLLLKKIILAANKNLSENIKWNAPNFHINGEDRITMRLQDGKPIQLILHRGAKVKVLPKENLISDKLLLLTWKTTDRAIISFTNIEDINSKATNLKIIVNKWLKATK